MLALLKMIRDFCDMEIALWGLERSVVWEESKEDTCVLACYIDIFLHSFLPDPWAKTLIDMWAGLEF